MKEQRGEHDVNRNKGGPGSSHQGGSHHQRAQQSAEDQRPDPGEPTNPDRSRISGGGGERDRHHTHDPKTKR